MLTLPYLMDTIRDIGIGVASGWHPDLFIKNVGSKPCPHTPDYLSSNKEMYYASRNKIISAVLLPDGTLTIRGPERQEELVELSISTSESPKILAFQQEQTESKRSSA